MEILMYLLAGDVCKSKVVLAFGQPILAFDQAAT